MPPPQWLDFEKLVARIYETIQPDATVTHDDKIRGIESGIERQIDVTISAKVAACDLLIAIQARDRKSSADVNVVGEFASVLKDVRASKGVLICNAGFTEGAVNLAANLGIDLCTAHSSEHRDWQLDLRIPVIWHHHVPRLSMHYRLALEAGDTLNRDLRDQRFSLDDGATSFTILELFSEQWNAKKIPRSTGTTHIFPSFDPLPKLLVSNTRWVQLTEFIITYVVEQTTWLKYVDTTEFTGLRHATSGELEPAGMRVELIIGDDPALPSVETGWLSVSSEDCDALPDHLQVVSESTPILSESSFDRGGITITGPLDDE